MHTVRCFLIPYLSRSTLASCCLKLLYGADVVDGIKARRPAYKERICQESQSLIFGGNGAQIVKWSLIIHRLPVGLAPKRIYRHGDAAHRQSGHLESTIYEPL